MTASEVRDYRVPAADGVHVALHRVPPEGKRREHPVLLVPGTFTARDFWLGARGQGFAGELARAGFDAWVLEHRGHGESDRPRRWTMSDWILRDAPAAVDFVLETTGADGLFWVGHSAGGVVGAAFAGSGHPAASRLRGVVLLGAPGPRPVTPLRHALAAAVWAGARLAPGVRIPGRPLGLGPESEPGALVHEWLGWNLRGAWRAPGGGDYLAALSAVRAPVLGVAGGRDMLLAPPAAVRDLLGRFGGDDRTLLVAPGADHAGLMIGGGARAEVWPRVVEWLAGRTSLAERT